MENKKLIDLFKSKGLLFPSTEKEIEEFEENNDIKNEIPNDWDNPSAIINRGEMNLSKLKFSEKDDFRDLKMAARKGIQSIPKDILDKMKNKHKNGDK